MVVSDPSSVLLRDFVEAVWLFKLHLITVPTSAELHLDSLVLGKEGGSGWSWGCEDDMLGFSIKSTEADFSTSLLLLFSVFTASFFLFD